MTITRKLIAGGLIAAAVVVIAYPSRSAQKNAPVASPQLDATREALRKATAALEEYTATKTPNTDPEQETRLKSDIERLAAEYVQLKRHR